MPKAHRMATTVADLKATAYLGGYPVSPATAREAWLLLQNEPTPEAVARMRYLHECAAKGIEPDAAPTEGSSE